MKPGFRLALITDRKAAPGGDIVRVAAGALAAGLRCVQLREKDLGGKELLGLAMRLRELTARHGAMLLVNDRVDVALAAGADGVHLGGSSLPVAEARRLLGDAALIGRSTHHAGEIREAEEQGADYVTFGPVYATPSKAAFGPPAGVAALAEACRATSLPVFALGGVKKETAGEVLAAGAFGIALISGIVAAADPASETRQFLSQFTREREGTP